MMKDNKNPIESYKLSKRQQRYGALKGKFDQFMALVGTVVLSPVFAGIVIASPLSSKGQKNKVKLLEAPSRCFF